MKVCLYSPYLPDHFGGGEKYLLDVALGLSRKHSVVVALPERYAGNGEIVKRYEAFLGRSLAGINFIPSPLGSKKSPLKKLLWTRQFDLIYYLTDGSLFLSLADKNILHIQFPLVLDKSSWWEQFKLKRWQLKNTNSKFTKSVVEQSWPVKIDTVHWPAVEVKALQAAAKKEPKQKIILSVGRFFRQLHSKRQDILIDIFRELGKIEPELIDGWKLVFIGGVEDSDYLTYLKRKKRNLPIEFYHDVSRRELRDWYGRASIYWHAAGYGIDTAKHPEKVEHFGISTAEAMAAGAVPLAYGQGGQIEVVGSNLSELLWLDRKECLAKTSELIRNKKQFEDYQQRVMIRAKSFGYDRFQQKLEWMLAHV